MQVSNRIEPSARKRQQRQLVATLIGDTLGPPDRMKRQSVGFEKVGADVQPLVNIAEIMRDQYDRNRLRDRPTVRLRLVTAQHANTKRNHLHDVKLATPNR